MPDFNVGNLATLIDPFFTSLQAHSNDLVGSGMTLLSIVFLLSAFGLALDFYLNGSLEDALTSAIKLMILTSFPLMMLSNWSGTAGKLENAMSTELPAMFGLAGGAPSAKLTSIITILQTAITPPGANGTQVDSNGQNPQQVKPVSTIDKIVNGVNSAVDYMNSAAPFAATGVGVLDTLVKLTDPKFFIGWLLYILNFILVSFLMFGCMMSIFMPIAGLKIGLVFGPLCIAMIPFRPMAGMATRWLDFMIANGVSLAVAGLVLLAISSTMVTMCQNMAQITTSSWGDMQNIVALIVSIAMMFAVYMFALGLLLQCNNIAQGMMGGSAVSEGLFGKIAAAAAGGLMVGTAKLGAKAGVMAGAAAGGPVLKGAGAVLSMRGNALSNSNPDSKYGKNLSKLGGSFTKGGKALSEMSKNSNLAKTNLLGRTKKEPNGSNGNNNPPPP